jgi:AbrB family looped-hinge helix DNA binding protein
MGLFNGIMALMNANIMLDNAGRIVIPKALRDTLGLVAGDVLALESDGERITLRPVRSGSRMRKEQGVWVFRSGRAISASETDTVLEALRDERAQGIRGAS